jgi:hypothetical protein
LELTTKSQEIIGKASRLAALLAEKIALKTEVSIKTSSEQSKYFSFFLFWPNKEINKFIVVFPIFYLDLIVSPFLSLLPESKFNPTLRWCRPQNYCNEMLCKGGGYYWH